MGASVYTKMKLNIQVADITSVFPGDPLDSNSIVLKYAAEGSCTRSRLFAIGIFYALYLIPCRPLCPYAAFFHQKYTHTYANTICMHSCTFLVAQATTVLVDSLRLFRAGEDRTGSHSLQGLLGGRHQP